MIIKIKYLLVFITDIIYIIDVFIFIVVTGHTVGVSQKQTSKSKLCNQYHMLSEHNRGTTHLKCIQACPSDFNCNVHNNND